MIGHDVDGKRIIFEPGCSDGWWSYEWEVVGKCPECGKEILEDGDAASGCNWGEKICETCGYRPCNGSC